MTTRCGDAVISKLHLDPILELSQDLDESYDFKFLQTFPFLVFFLKITVMVISEHDPASFKQPETITYPCF